MRHNQHNFNEGFISWVIVEYAALLLPIDKSYTWQSEPSYNNKSNGNNISLKLRGVLFIRFFRSQGGQNSANPSCECVI